MIFKPENVTAIAKLLSSKKIGILPTDTIYGIHCLALQQDLIDKIYKIKKRPATFPFITLISNATELQLFEIKPTDFETEQINKFWPGPNTLIFKTQQQTTRSFRIPANTFLQSLLKLTGPLISTSANIHGQPVVTNIKTAITNFKDEIDFYVDGGELNNPPSNVYDLTQGVLNKIR